MTKGRTVRLVAIAALTTGLVVATAGQAGAQPKTFAPEGFSAPASTSVNNGARLDVFQNISGSILQKTWNPTDGWSRPADLAAPPGEGGAWANPAATWTADGTRLDVFVTSVADRHIYQKTLITGSAWTEWMDLGGELYSPPAAAWTNNGNRIDIFGIGADFRPYQKSWTAGVGWVDWTGFDQPAGLTGSGPSITWTASGSRLDIFLRGRNDKHVYQKSWIAGTGWSGWGDLGGIVESAPSASWVANGSRIDIFAIGADFRPYQKSWAAGAGWSDWIGFEPPPGASGSSPSVSWAADASRLDVFVTNEAEGATYQKTWSAAGGWTAWANM